MQEGELATLNAYSEKQKMKWTKKCTLLARVEFPFNAKSETQFLYERDTIAQVKKKQVLTLVQRLSSCKSVILMDQTFYHSI